MHNHKPQTDRIMQKGFARIPVDNRSKDQAVESIMDRAGQRGRPKDCGRIRRIKPIGLYALAASILLVMGLGIMVGKTGTNLFDIFKPAAQKAEHDQIKESVIKIVDGSDGWGPEERLLHPKDEIKTDKQSQLLVSIGTRTRVLVLEKTAVKVSSADKIHTRLDLQAGTAVFDVCPGGKDTISVRTVYGTFVQIGTRFSVSVDSCLGARLEVFSGKVLVRDSSGGRLYVEPKQVWTSKKRHEIGEVDRSSEELTGLDQIFTHNKIESPLRWESRIEAEMGIKEGGPKYSNRLGVSQKVSRKKRNSPADEISQTVSLIQEKIGTGDYDFVRRKISRLSDSRLIDTLYVVLRQAAKREIDLFRYKNALPMLDLVAGGEAFSKYQREDAWMERYMLHKDFLRTPAPERLKVALEYEKLPSGGALGDDMLAEIIHLRLLIEDYEKATLDMKRLLRTYPESIHAEYYGYLYASTLREHFSEKTEALKAYKDYVSLFPNGKYEEDALYWIVRLSESIEDKTAALHYKKRYLSSYPRGRWSDELGK